MNNPIDLTELKYILADLKLKESITRNWNEVVGNHMHIEDGVSIVRMHDDEPISIISVYWKQWIEPLEQYYDGYIDIIEVKPEYRRQGIAKYLVEAAEKECRARNISQIRAWSSDNKIEAINMWKRLGYGMCPARILSGYEQDELVSGYYVVKTLI